MFIHLSQISSIFYSRFKQFKLIKKFEPYKSQLNELLIDKTQNNNENDDDEYENIQLKKTELNIFINVSIERKKTKFGRTIQREYMEKVIIYGYVMVS